MRYLLTGIGLFTLAGLFVASPGLADQNLNCNQYASQAVTQHKKNIVEKCGFHGAGWSANYKEHLDWCQLDIVKMEHLTYSDSARTTALKQCAAKNAAQKTELKPGPKFEPVVTPRVDARCGQYALNARQQNQENHVNNCGFTGGDWSDDVNGHRAWCIKTKSTAVDLAHITQARVRQLTKCKTAKVFDNPKGRKVKGRRWPLDECNSSDRLFCGETIARDFCKRQGFNKVASFVKGSASSPPAKNRGTPGVVSSYLDYKGYCGGRTCTFFRQITCKGVS